MTIQQLYISNAFYLLVLAVVVILTRPSLRRVGGAVAGALAAGASGAAIVAVCQQAGWWHFTMNWEHYHWLQLGLGFAISGVFVFLLTWRLARRFGGRGLAIALLLTALLAPFRDSALMAMFPEWGYYAPGIAPMLAISLAYVFMGVVGHGLMRVIAGPATSDSLTRRRIGMHSWR